MKSVFLEFHCGFLAPLWSHSCTVISLIHLELSVCNCRRQMSPITFPPYRTIVHLFEACVKYHTCNSHPARWRSPQHQNTDMLISHALPHNNFSLAQQNARYTRMRIEHMESMDITQRFPGDITFEHTGSALPSPVLIISSYSMTLTTTP